MQMQTQQRTPLSNRETWDETNVSSAYSWNSTKRLSYHDIIYWLYLSTSSIMPHIAYIISTFITRNCSIDLDKLLEVYKLYFWHWMILLLLLKRVWVSRIGALLVQRTTMSNCAPIGSKRSRLSCCSRKNNGIWLQQLQTYTNGLKKIYQD